MILLDTCAIIFAALKPEQLGRDASSEIFGAGAGRSLACSDISLWEIAMLVSRGRITISADPREFIARTLLAFRLDVLPITPDIAVMAADDRLFIHKDPADRIIASTSLHAGIPLITCDVNLRSVQNLKTVW